MVRYLLWLSLLMYFPARAQVVFTDTSYIHLFEAASLQEKGVMIDAYTDNCFYCKKMDSTAFADTAFGKFCNDRFIASRINAEEGFGIDFAMKYRIGAFPQVLIFDASGHLLYRWIGYANARMLQSFIHYQDSAGNFLQPLPQPFNFELDYPDFYRNTFKKRPDRSYPDPGQVKQFLSGRDVTEEVTWGVMSALATDPSWMDSILHHRDELNHRYSSLEVNSALQKFVFAEVKEAIKDVDEGRLFRALRMADRSFGADASEHRLRYSLYYYQMTGNWEGYLHQGESLVSDPVLYDSEKLTEIAQTLYRNTHNTALLEPAQKWMIPIVQTHKTYETVSTLAWLNFKLGHTEIAAVEAAEALRIAKDQEIKDTTETEALVKQINLKN